MSDYTSIEYNAETGETIERTMTQDEIDALMVMSATFMESITIETENAPMPFEPSEPNPLPESDKP